MSGFQIPGLGQAKPNETLPPLRADMHVEAAHAAGPADQAQEPHKRAEGPAPTEAEGEHNQLHPEDGVSQDQAQLVGGPMVVDRPEKPSVTSRPNETLPPFLTDVPVAAQTAGPVEQTQEAHEQAKGTTPNEPETEQSQTQPNSGVSRDQAQFDGGPMVIDRQESPPSLTSALEAALAGLEPDTNMTQAETQAEPQPDGGELQPDQSENPEWEVDSSPYESSSESSSSDSDNENYELLGVEETARLLMEMEGGHDDEFDKGNKAMSAAQLRTKNELPEEPIPKPDVTITPEMKVEELGSVEHIVEGTILVKAITPGEYQVLDTGSVLCTEDRKVIGVVAETIGKVLQPMYTVRFSSQDEIKDYGVQVGTKIFYPVDHAFYVFTEPLKSLKGSDTSNIHDEEVAADEMEFSDDEKEAEYKRALKNKKTKNKGPGDGGRGGRGPHPLRQEMAPEGELNYDDGPYKPLARPPGFGSGAAPGEPAALPPRPQNQRGGGRRGDRRGRGGRGRDSGRGGGRGGHDLPRDGHSLPPRGYQQPALNQQPGTPWPPSNPPVLQAQGSAPTMPAFGFHLPPSWSQQQPPHQAHGAPATLPPPPPPPPPGWPSQGPAHGHQSVNGTFVNPAFIAALMSQMQGQSGHPQQPPPPPSGGWS